MRGSLIELVQAVSFVILGVAFLLHLKAHRYERHLPFEFTCPHCDFHVESTAAWMVDRLRADHEEKHR